MITKNIQKSLYDIGHLTGLTYVTHLEISLGDYTSNRQYRNEYSNTIFKTYVETSHIIKARWSLLWSLEIIN